MITSRDCSLFASTLHTFCTHFAHTQMCLRLCLSDQRDCACVHLLARYSVSPSLPPFPTSLPPYLPHPLLPPSPSLPPSPLPPSPSRSPSLPLSLHLPRSLSLSLSTTAPAPRLPARTQLECRLGSKPLPQWPSGQLGEGPSPAEGNDGATS